MKDDQRMASWIADVKGVVFQLSQIGVTLPDEDTILALTNGLPPSYGPLVLTLNSTPSEIFNLDYVIVRLRTEETHQQPEPGGLDTTDHALATTGTCDWPKRPVAHITCFGCGKTGHYRVNCPTDPMPMGPPPPTFALLPAPAPAPAPPRYRPHNKPVDATAVTLEDDEGDGFW
jgi:hypothetical protein